MKRGAGLLKTMTSSFTMATLAFVLITQSLFAPNAQAGSSTWSQAQPKVSPNPRCEALFIPRVLPEGQRLYNFVSRDLPPDATLKSSLPNDFQSLMDRLDPKIAKKFEKRFQKRERVLAETEARKLVYELLFDSYNVNTKIFSGRTRAARREALTQVLNARLDVKDAEIHVEQMLLEIGYGEGTPAANKWRDFREKNFGKLSFILRNAINLATMYTLGIPVANLKPYNKYQLLRPTRTQRHFWNIIEPVVREKIRNQDPRYLGKLQGEIFLKIVARIAIAGVLALVADKALEHITPKWHVYKMSHGGREVIDTREQLEKMAYDNWKTLMTETMRETGLEPPDDSSPEAKDILNRIKATPKPELWIHVYENGPLSDPANPPPQFSPDPALRPSEEIQMSPAPNFGP